MSSLTVGVEEYVEVAPLPIRLVRGIDARARPWLGWASLAVCMAMTLLPAASLRSNRWLALGGLQGVLEVAGPLGVLCVWLFWGWRKPVERLVWWRGPLLWLIGLLLLSQLLLGWIPGPVRLVQAALQGSGAAIPLEIAAKWSGAATRFVLWSQGVASGGAAQDNLVFATLGALVLWSAGVATAWLGRKTMQGYAAGAPTVWLLALVLLYSSNGRWLLVLALALMLLLQLLLDQENLNARWQRLQLDYSPSVLIDRMVTVASAAALILTLAVVMPNLYYEPLVVQYYRVLGPMNERWESLSERLFPELQGTSRLPGGGLGSGLPNDFLLRGGPNLGTAVVMQVRTDETPTYQLPFDEMVSPPGHYMRSGTLSEYDGRGWRNPPTERTPINANQRWGGEVPWGRKLVVQSVIMRQSSSVIFSVPEPVEVSVDVRREVRAENDAVALCARDPSYTVVSAVPAVDDEMLRSLPAWGAAMPLPAEIAPHLALPESVTPRLRELATQLASDQPTMYDQALAIEQYLRQFVYDLDVPEPPATVSDVADYFIFDLQRGYCDYYATAFVVLARLMGLPARFATGYAVGSWDPVEMQFVITEAEAHSWPEVYFPQIGWVPFEPTAGRPTLTRIAAPQFTTGIAASAPAPVVQADEAESEPWNWQPLLWLLPIGLVLWGAWQALVVLRRRREDPWLALLRWGGQMGRPMAASETVLEYGAGLAGHILGRFAENQDASRVAAREVQAVSEAVNDLRYGPSGQRTRAERALAEHWARLRDYLRLVRLRQS